MRTISNEEREFFFLAALVMLGSPVTAFGSGSSWKQYDKYVRFRQEFFPWAKASYWGELNLLDYHFYEWCRAKGVST